MILSGGKFPIIGWVNPSSYPYENSKEDRNIPVSYEVLKERYSEYKQAGFNMVFCMRDPIGTNDEVVKNILKVCGELDLGCLLIDGESYARAVSEERLAYIKDYVKEFPAFKGLMIFDEPNAIHFKTVGENFDKFIKVFPDKLFYVNMLPNYATDEQLGTASFSEYVDRFVAETKVNFLTYDHYPFIHFSYGIVNNNKYFTNLSAVSEKARKEKLPFMVFIETTAFIKNTHIPNREEIMWQVNTALSYGAKGIQYFTYSMPADTSETFSGALIARDGTRTAAFDAVREINVHIAVISQTLTSADFKGVIKTGVTPLNEFDERIPIPDEGLISSFGKLESVVGGNTLTGCFEDDGKEVIYLTNNDFTSASEVYLQYSEKVTLTAIRGAKEISLGEGKEFRLILNSGEGVLIMQK